MNDPELIAISAFSPRGFRGDRVVALWRRYLFRRDARNAMDGDHVECTRMIAAHVKRASMRLRNCARDVVDDAQRVREKRAALCSINRVRCGQLLIHAPKSTS